MFDPSRLIKTWRNDFSYSQSPESSKKVTRKLYLEDPLLSGGNSIGVEIGLLDLSINDPPY